MLDFGLSKRQKIITVSILVSIGLLSTQLVDFSLRFRFILGLSVFSYIVVLWALWEGLNKTKAVVLLTLPTLFTLAVVSFYFLLPIRWLTRLPVAFIFGLLFYLLLLAQNVFNVAAIRTIPLYRAASTTTFLFTVFTAFCIYSVIGALNLPFYWNTVLTFVISLMLVLPILWSAEMKDLIDSEVLAQSIIISLVLAEISLVLSFWPTHSSIRPYAVGSALTSSIYVLLGLTSHYLKGRLTGREVVEYLIFGLIVWVMAYVITSWTI